MMISVTIKVAEHKDVVSFAAKTCDDSFLYFYPFLQFCHHRNPKTGKALGYWDDSLKFMGGTITMTTMIMITRTKMIIISTHQGSQKMRPLAIIGTWQ